MPRPAPYANPYIAGFCLGLVLLAAFGLAGRGLGASGGFASVASAGIATIAPDAAGNAYFGHYLANGGPGHDWLVFEVLGVLVGAFLSAAAAGRLRLSVDRGPRMRTPARMVQAVAGGTIMGLGAVLARGCTSGQALTGGALLSVGSWLFMIAAFIGGFAVAPLLRKAWR